MRTDHFRRIVETDLSLIARWRAAEHVREWWGAPSVEDEREKLVDPRITMWIVELDGCPFAFAQDYDVHGWEPHPFSYLPPQSRGIDQYIGEADMLDQGHGSAFVRQHVERLFAAGAPAVGTDPHPSNARARRAYEKAGFAVTSKPVDTPWGARSSWSAGGNEQPLSNQVVALARTTDGMSARHETWVRHKLHKLGNLGQAHEPGSTSLGQAHEPGSGTSCTS